MKCNLAIFDSTKTEVDGAEYTMDESGLICTYYTFNGEVIVSEGISIVAVD